MTDWYIPFDASCFSCESAEVEPPRLSTNISFLIWVRAFVSSSTDSLEYKSVVSQMEVPWYWQKTYIMRSLFSCETQVVAATLGKGLILASGSKPSDIYHISFQMSFLVDIQCQHYVWLSTSFFLTAACQTAKFQPGFHTGIDVTISHSISTFFLR